VRSMALQSFLNTVGESLDSSTWLERMRKVEFTAEMKRFIQSFLSLKVHFSDLLYLFPHLSE
jgi:hypothetical protein